MTITMPFLSIIIPVFNRERLIGRTLRSCLSQRFEDFEVIVIDDASTDGSAELVEAIRDSRLRLIREPVNRGCCPSRNRGIAEARGKWILCLDSDDEIVPHGFETIHDRCMETPDDIGGIRFMCRMDDGTISPIPALADEDWGYADFLRWLERAAFQRPETFLCARRETFETVRYSGDRSLELAYHLNFSARYRTRTVPDVVRLYHQDASNSISRSSASAILSRAPDELRSVEGILRTHGEGLQSWAPNLYANLLKGCATLSFLSGERAKGLHYARRCLRAGPLSVELLVVVLLGTLGPLPISLGKRLRTCFRTA
jgi:glycosyltransferase involved in cell wall biosynthesis